MKTSIAAPGPLDDDEILAVPKFYKKLVDEHRDKLAQLSPWRAFWFRLKLWLKAKHAVSSRL